MAASTLAHLPLIPPGVLTCLALPRPRPMLAPCLPHARPSWLTCLCWETSLEVKRGVLPVALCQLLGAWDVAGSHKAVLMVPEGGTRRKDPQDGGDSSAKCPQAPVTAKAETEGHGLLHSATVSPPPWPGLLDSTGPLWGAGRNPVSPGKMEGLSTATQAQEAPGCCQSQFPPSASENPERQG